MIALEDRQALARDIHLANRRGARLHLAYETAGINVRKHLWLHESGDN